MKGTIAGGTIGVALSAGLLTPRVVLAAWPKAVMESKNMMNTGVSTSSIKLDMPEIAENGAVVPITIDASGVEGKVESISVLAAANGTPLAATYNFKQKALAFVSTRLKMSKTGDVYGVVKTATGTFYTKAQIKVTIGGCGG
jgi:sulfur-oxidizing protein SoxY